MASPSSSHSAYFFPSAPVPSTSNDDGALLDGVTPPSPAQQQPYAGTFGGKKLSCLTCRKGKAKCIWIDGTDTCELCLKRGLECPGSAAPQRKRKAAASSASPSPAPADATVDANAVDWAAFEVSSPPTPSAGNFNSPTAQPAPSSSLVPYNSTPPPITQSWSTSTATPSFSPYHTTSGRPRVLGPSSSEGSLNALARAQNLRTELIALYQNLWPMQLAGWPIDSFSEFLDNRGADPASRVMASLATASGARSSNHSQILSIQGPSLREVDEDLMGQFTPGGFSEWGLRRHGPSVALAQKAIQEAITLLQRDPSPRTLKVALAGVALYNGLYNDRRVIRPFLLVAIETWHRVRDNAAISAEDREWLVAKAGSVLLMRDCYYSISTGGSLAFTDDECTDVLATFDHTALVDCFGVPIVPADESLVVVEESFIYHTFFATELSLLHSLVHIFGNGNPRILFGTLALANLSALQDLMDRMKVPILERLAALEAIDESRVFVLHEWTGSWRPDNMKDHAIIIVSEVISDLYVIDIQIYARLQLELSLGRIDLDAGRMASLMATARERLRRALKNFVLTIQRLQTSKRQHATFSNAFHHIVNCSGFVEVVLSRYGEPGGPVAKEDEFSADDIGWLVRAFRVGSYSQSTLVTPLRELEAGWELLRRDEVARALSRSPLDLSSLLVDG